MPEKYRMSYTLIVKFVTEYNIKLHRHLEVNISNPFTAERK